jgi:type IV secretory pathway component VirB8
MSDTTLLLHQENLLQRRAWKFFSIFLVIIIIAQVAVISFLSKLVSEKREVVKYVEFSDRGDFAFRVLPEGGIDISQRKLLIEQQLQQYVINRISNVASKKQGNREIDSNKIKFVAALSSKQVSEQYEAEVFRIYNEADFIRREVSILSNSELEDRKYRYDFITTDILENGETLEQRWVVYIRYDLVDPNTLTVKEHKAINPLGVKITYYRGDIDTKSKINIQNGADIQQD